MSGSRVAQKRVRKHGQTRYSVDSLVNDTSILTSLVIPAEKSVRRDSTEPRDIIALCADS